MNPIIILLAAGYGYLAGNPKARNQFFSSVQQIAGKGIDALNNVGKSEDVSKNVSTSNGIDTAETNQ